MDGIQERLKKGNFNINLLGDEKQEDTYWWVKYVVEIFIFLSALVIIYGYIMLNTKNPMSPKKIYEVLRSYFKAS